MYRLLLILMMMLMLLGVPPRGVYNQNTVVDGITVKNACEGDLVSCVLYTNMYQDCRALTFALARLSVCLNVCRSIEQRQN